jgi:hypothetical protein
MASKRNDTAPDARGPPDLREPRRRANGAEESTAATLDTGGESETNRRVRGGGQRAPQGRGGGCDPVAPLLHPDRCESVCLCRRAQTGGCSGNTVSLGNGEHSVLGERGTQCPWGTGNKAAGLPRSGGILGRPVPCCRRRLPRSLRRRDSTGPSSPLVVPNGCMGSQFAPRPSAKAASGAERSLRRRGRGRSGSAAVWAAVLADP